MIITRSPLRISFAGGGSDIPAFYAKHGPGAVVSTSINRYVYVTLNEKFGGGLSVRYRVHENADVVSELKHPLIREVLKFYGVESGVEIVVSSDVPARGSGLGASSALACALVAAMQRYKHGAIALSREELAAQAAQIEIEKVCSPIGKQDHYSSALGGINLLLFKNDGTVERTAFDGEQFAAELEAQSMLFYLDMEHAYKDAPKSSEVRVGGSFVQTILHDQVESMEQKYRTYALQRDNALALWEHMTYEVPERFIDHVNENWRLKRTTHQDITNSRIDEIVQRAYRAGATAAKVCGAGGGGFVYFVVPPSMQESVRKALSELKELRFRFDKKGTEVLFDDTESKTCEPSATI